MGHVDRPDQGRRTETGPATDRRQGHRPGAVPTLGPHQARRNLTWLPMPALPDLDVARIRQYCARRVPARLRDEARVEADVRGKSVTIYDCRPPWHPDLTDWSRVPVAQLRYDPTDHLWSLYWADRNSRWHLMDDVTPAATPAPLLAELDADPTGIFWG
jgi:hypothetical protein